MEQQFQGQTLRYSTSSLPLAQASVILLYSQYITVFLLMVSFLVSLVILHEALYQIFD